MKPSIPREEIRRQAQVVADMALRLQTLALRAGNNPDGFTEVESGHLTVLARTVGCKVNTLDYYIQGNPRPKTGESADGGVSKTIEVNPHV